MSFLKAGTDDEVVVPHTFVSFFDVDSTSHPIAECVQSKDSTQSFFGANSELHIYRTSADRQQPQARRVFDAVSAADPAVEEWPTPLVCSSITGVGKDNPADPLSLTELQRSRSVMFLIQSRSSFSVRLALSGCCSTGRMFLFA